jgi:diguanylate cyclase (GGDEF)-like protein
MQVNSISLFLLFCGILLAAIALYSWRRRFVRGALWFSLFMLAISIYVTGYFFELSSVNLTAMLFWNKIQYIGTLLLPPFCLLFALHFSQKTDAIKRWVYILLFLISALLFTVKLFDDSLRLFYTDVRMDSSGPLSLLVFTPGPAYYFTSIYHLILLSYGTFQVYAARKYSSPLYRKQTSIMAGVGFVILIVYVFYISGYRPFHFLENIDFNPFGFTAWALAITYAILRHRLFELVPFAREKLIETLTEGVLVFDGEYRLVDGNPASRRIFDWDQIPTGLALDQVFSGWSGAEGNDKDFKNALHKGASSIETCRLIAGKPSWFDIHITLLQESGGEIEGRLLVLHDITARKMIEKELRELSLEDELTGLKNRRGFFTLAGQMIKMVARMKLSAALVYIDLDGLKTINDTLGHAQGDRAIITVGQTLAAHCRSSDVVCRLGGDEFVLLTIGSEKDFSEIIAARMDDILDSLKREADFPGGLAFSYGVVNCKSSERCSLEELLNQADRAMYAQKTIKKSGRGSDLQR